MNTIEAINFQHVERLKLTGDTTVFVGFVSGASRTFEFSDSARAASMVLAFENWCNERKYGGYVVSIGQDGKARAR
jgi:hypothetical protein